MVVSKIGVFDAYNAEITVRKGYIFGKGKKLGFLKCCNAHKNMCLKKRVDSHCSSVQN